MSDLLLASSHDHQIDLVARKRVPAWVRLFSIFGLLLFTGALNRPVGGDTLQGSMATVILRESNQSIAIIGALVYAIAALLLLTQKRNLRVPKSMYPILILNAWILLSSLWSADPARTLMRASGLSGCTLFAIFILNTFDREEIIRQLVYSASILVAMTAAVAILIPDYAFHNSSEFYSEHSGLLKGTFGHKNNLGKVISYCIICLITIGHLVVRNKILYVLLVFMAFYTFSLTGSAKTIATVPAAIFAGIGLLMIKDVGARTWIVAMTALLWFAAESLGLIDTLMQLLLSSLDRDPTLSGRTLIWSAALTFATQTHPILGGGYEAAWDGGIGRAVQAVVGIDPSHAHNGYIMTYLELGVFGFGILLFAIWRIIDKLIRTSPNQNNKLYFFLSSWVVLFIANNTSGSYITQPGDIYWLQLTLTPVMLTWISSRENSEKY
jgi:exopolysaccharide production protein ExoQ